MANNREEKCKRRGSKAGQTGISCCLPLIYLTCSFLVPAYRIVYQLAVHVHVGGVRACAYDLKAVLIWFWLTMMVKYGEKLSRVNAFEEMSNWVAL